MRAPEKITALSARWVKPLALAGALAAVWTVGVGVWLPGFVRTKAEVAATDALGTPVHIGALHIQPWTLSVSADDVVMGPPGAEWFKLKQAHVQLSLESVWRLAPVVRRVQLTAPEFWLERQSAQRFNISPVIDKLMAPSPKPKPAGEPVRFAVFNVALTDGVIRYTDRVLKQEHVIDQLHLGVPFVSNLPSQIDVEVVPELKARIDGSPLSLQGKVLPFQAGHRSEIKLDWQSVDVAHWLGAAQPFLPAALGLKPGQGKLDTALTVRFEQRPAPAVASLSIQGGVQLSQLALTVAHAPALGQVEVGWRQFKLDGLDARPLEQQARVASVMLDGLTLKARPVVGAVSPASDKAAPVVSPPASSSSPAWRWSVAKLQLVTDAVDVQTEADAPWPRLDRIQVQAGGLTSDPKSAPATWQVDVADQHGAKLHGQGQIQVAQQHVVAALALDHAHIPAWLAPIARGLALPVQIQQGELAVQTKVDARFQRDPAIQWADGVIRLQNVQTQASSSRVKDQIKVAGLAVDGLAGELSLASEAKGLKRLDVASVTLDQLDAQLTRGAQGTWLGMPASPAKPASRAAANKAASPVVALKLLRCQTCRVQVTDQTVTPAAVLSVQKTDLSVQNLSTDLSQTLTVDLRALAQGQGRINVQGDVRPQPLLVKAKLGVAGVDLRALQSYIDPHVNIQLAAAKAQADGRLVLQDDARKGLSARYQGRLGLTDLRVLDRVNDADFLSWRSLTLDKTNLGWADGQIDADLGKMALQSFYGRVIINPNGQLNLASIAKREAGAAPKSLTTPEPAAPAPVAVSSASSAAAPAVPAAAPMKLRWQGIQLSKGRIDFTDNFIKPNYSADLTRIEGAISAVASDKPEPATVSVAGAVDDGAPLQITGQLHPLGPRLYTDIQGSAKGIELTRLTPYAARYAGYNIEKGSLSVNVHYKVDGGKLEADNKIFLDQLTFGDKTDSPDATKLPVLFAVSLLKNTRGEIDINLPISGSLDDPQFSVGGIIWRVFVNLITKAVTAPFSLLSGGGGDELGFVPFEAGSAVLSDAARQRLDALAGKLNDRPALKLEATGRADPAVDVDGLRQAHVDRLMRVAKAKATGQSPDDVSVGADERDTWLTAAYKAADIKKPRNLVGLAKSLPSADMLALLKASAPVGPEVLRDLADTRGNAVKAYLSARISPERVLLTASKVGVEGLAQDKGPSSRVQFDIK
ncbi:DUF748 domain-containing protein [Aquabacterium sp.]|uniref:DUF748 domain-containing protein n=1 Tax=Aquabacterium sp. TaxID=1872578 RepID=UPI003B756857